MQIYLFVVTTQCLIKQNIFVMLIRFIKIFKYFQRFRNLPDPNLVLLKRQDQNSLQ